MTRMSCMHNTYTNDINELHLARSMHYSRMPMTILPTPTHTQPQEHTMSHINTQSNQYTDLDLQWFRGGIRVTDVVNLITNDDIVSEGRELIHTCTKRPTPHTVDYHVTHCMTPPTSAAKIPRVGKKITLSPKAYLSALSHIGTDVWEMLTLGGTHTQPPMLCGEVHTCPTCENTDYIPGECEECYLISA
jgi:hypothetical protein